MAYDNSCFITASRDKTIKIWEKSNDYTTKFELVKTVSFNESVNAVNIFPERINDSLILFIGLENGDFYVLSYKSGTEKVILKLHDNLTFSESVRRIKSINKNDTILISACSDDHSVRLLEINKKDLHDLC